MNLGAVLEGDLQRINGDLENKTLKSLEIGLFTSEYQFGINVANAKSLDIELEGKTIEEKQWSFLQILRDGYTQFLKNKDAYELKQ